MRSAASDRASSRPAASIRAYPLLRPFTVPLVVQPEAPDSRPARSSCRAQRGDRPRRGGARTACADTDSVADGPVLAASLGVSERQCTRRPTTPRPRHCVSTRRPPASGRRRRRGCQRASRSPVWWSPDDTRFERIALVVQRQLFALGIDMQLQPVPDIGQLRRADQRGDYDAFIFEIAAAGRSVSLPVLALARRRCCRLGYSAADDALDRMMVARTDEETRAAVAGRDAASSVTIRRLCSWRSRARHVPRTRPSRFRTKQTGTCSDTFRQMTLGASSASARSVRRITSRFVMLIATAAVAPLVVYGVLSIGKLRQGTELSVSQGNLRIAEQVAARLKLYLDNNARVLRSVGYGNQRHATCSAGSRSASSRTTSSSSRSSARLPSSMPAAPRHRHQQRRRRPVTTVRRRRPTRRPKAFRSCRSSPTRTACRRPT